MMAYIPHRGTGVVCPDDILCLPRKGGMRLQNHITGKNRIFAKNNLYA